MSNIDDLVRSREGDQLYALACDGNHDASVGFARLVFLGNYEGNPKAGETKKAAKEQALSEAQRLLEAAAVDEHFEGLRLQTDLYRLGARNPKSGAQLFSVKYHQGEQGYKKLLDHPECPDDLKGQFLIHQGKCILMKDQIKEWAEGWNRTDQALALFRQALEYPESEKDAHFALAGTLWSIDDYEQGAYHAHQCYKMQPWAALILYSAYDQGLGVDPDPEQAQWFYQFWVDETNKK